LIEDVLQRAFIDERLVEQKSKLTIDFPKIAASDITSLLEIIACHHSYHGNTQGSMSVSSFLMNGMA